MGRQTKGNKARFNSSWQIVRIILFGSYAEENLGDDLMLCVQIDQIRQRYGKVSIVIFTGNPEITRSFLETENLLDEHIKLVYTGRRGLLEPGKPVLSSLNWFSQNFIEIFRANLILIGPGNQIQDVTRKYRVLFFISRALTAWLLWTPYAYFGIGFFSLKGRFCRWALKHTANHSAFVSARDMGGAERFLALGVKPELVHGLTDISFLYQYNKKTDVQPDDVPIIGLNSRIFFNKMFSPEVSANFLTALALLLKNIHMNIGAKFRFFSFYRASQWSDKAAYEQLLQHLNSPDFPMGFVPFHDIQTTCNEMASCDAFIGVRYHSVLVSIQNDIPVLAISYGEKTWRFMDENRLSDYCIKLEDITADRLQNIWWKLWYNRKLLHTTVRKIQIEANYKAHKHFALIDNVLLQGSDCQKEDLSDDPERT